MTLFSICSLVNHATIAGITIFEEFFDTEESDIAENRRIRILRSLNEVGEYMYRSEGDIVMLPSPKHAPVVFKRWDIGWVKDSHEFAN